MNTLLTGHAGFIGFHTARRLLERGDPLVGIDSVNDYYDPALKRARLAILAETAARTGTPYRSVEGNLADRALVEGLFETGGFERVINLAAQAGVRHSLVDPYAYVESNVLGFTTLLEGCRHAGVKHLTFASTSSVYGANRSLPFREDAGADHPIQFYAATKRGNELMAHSYAHLFGLPVTGLRFFTVYGPWGRPDMALFKFTRAILEDRPIDVFNGGHHTRDFTYVDDIVEGVLRVSDRPAAPDPAFDAMAPTPATSAAPYRILNIGNNAPVELNAYIDALEEALGRKARRNLLPLQPGDVPDTFADVSRLEAVVGTWPRVSVTEGIARFVDWYRRFYGV
ncbi:NAD-dependent epimerase [Aurantimonas sp. Leaf443]|uniref:NAD-dependent epimerase n=1 Tax=Aurantimonas sp. Leaf443 TaxID=1736378 RepID=UPI0006FA2177|nr:NAD-dependent epimerase [Aurantimonas sp. Leaf443]KQT88319.1 capsular biosynthesis protein CpsI [Aurantimonas sp. Leaf443]